MSDLLETRAELFLGSRLRRLGERLQADVMHLVEAAGLPVQPSQYPILATLDAEGPRTIGDLAAELKLSQPAVTRAVGKLVELGLVSLDRLWRDQRLKTASLTEAGQAAVARSKVFVWPRVEAAVREALEGLEGPLLQQLSGLEGRVAERPLHRRAAAYPPPVRILDYAPELSPAFKAINEEWISRMYRVEPADLRVLDDPEGTIIAKGGVILFAEVEGLGVVGTCALEPMGDGAWELIKMGVLESARGAKVGEALLKAVIARADAMGIETLFLLSNRKSQAAIHLYEKAGFVHDAEVLARYGAEFERCDVAMRYVRP